MHKIIAECDCNRHDREQQRTRCAGQQRL